MSPFPVSPCLTHHLSPGPLLSVLSPGQTSLTLTATLSGVLTTPSNTIVNIHQTPILLTSDPSSTVLVLIGAFRRATILTRRSARVDIKTFILPGAARLTPTSITLQFNPSSLTLLDATTNTHFTLSYTDFSLNSSRHIDQPPRDPSHIFRRLLRAIDDLSDAERHVSSRSSSLDTCIASYNSFLACAPRLTGRPVITASPRVPCSLHEPSPVAGRVVYLNIGITPILQGWQVRCSVVPLMRYASCMSTRSTPRRVVTLPLTGEVSFPIVLSSHVPLQVAFELIFRDSRIPLSSTTLDILDCSAPNMAQSDVSHVSLAPLATLLDTHRTPTSVTARLQLPLPVSALRDLPTGEFSTVLGGAFCITVMSSAKEDTSTVTIHGACHVVPFVRAALLRRVLQQDVLTPVTANGAAAIARWKRALADGINEWLPSFRRAETALTEARTVYERIHAGQIEECYDRGEQRVCRDAVLTARASYGMLRRTFETLWSLADRPV